MQFLADVLRPALDALAPHDRRKALGRVRWLFLGFALLALLVPPADALGTADETSRLIQCGALVLVGLVAWVEKRMNAAGWGTAVAGVVVAVFVHVVAGRLWGVGAGLTAVALVAAVEARRRFDRLPPPPPAEDLGPYDASGIPRMLHSVALMVGVALILRVFAFEAVFVPTGSMQPTIMGDRGAVGGDKLIVERGAYLTRDPQRWDIAVFHYPLYRPLNFVKRVVGLPGETVEIRDGDIWVDGAVATKPELVQESLWHEVFPGRELSRKKRKLANAWSLSEDDGWRREGDHGVRLSRKAGSTGFARYRSRGRVVPDRRLSFLARPTPGAVVHATIRSRGVLTTLSIRASGGDDETGGVLRIQSRDEVDLASVPAGDWRVSLAVVDGQAIATLNGRELARLEAPLSDGRQNAVTFGGGDGEITFGAVKLEEDVYFRRQGRTKWEVPEGSFVALGDNSEQSRDSRHWQVSEIDVPHSSIGEAGEGQATIRFSPQLPTEFGTQRENLRREGSDTVFEDVHGVERRIPTAEILSTRHRIAAPFFRREHLIGRATLIFWPWTASEAGFRPRILW